MRSWIVEARITLRHTIEANSKQEAERLASDAGDQLAEYIWKDRVDGKGYWTAKAK